MHLLLRGVTGIVLTWIVLAGCFPLFFLVDDPAYRIIVGLCFIFLLAAVFGVVTAIAKVGRKE